jgi:hypothetical protein
MEVFKIVVYFLNRVQSKLVPKTPYELWIRRKLTLNYLHVWDCPAKAKVFNPSIGKLDLKTVSCHCIGYQDKPKGFHFYCPNIYTKFLETRDTIFFRMRWLGELDILRDTPWGEAGICAYSNDEETTFLIPVNVTPIVNDTVCYTFCQFSYGKS